MTIFNISGVVTKVSEKHVKGDGTSIRVARIDISTRDDSRPNVIPVTFVNEYAYPKCGLNKGDFVSVSFSLEGYFHRLRNGNTELNNDGKICGVNIVAERCDVEWSPQIAIRHY